MDQSAPPPELQPRPAEEPRQRRGSARARRPRQRQRAIMLSAVAALAVAAGAWAAFGRGGGPAAHHPRASAAAAPLHRRSQSHSVQFVVEASGDLLIHSAIFERALLLGGGRHYNFAPFFEQIKPYIQGADLPLCHVETPMTPAPPTGYPTFNTPARTRHRDRSDGVASVLDGCDAHSRSRTDGSR